MNIFRRIAGWLQTRPHFHYACITDSGVCYAVVRLDVQLQHPGVIAVDELDASLIGQRWIRGQWIRRHPRHAACPVIQSDIGTGPGLPDAASRLHGLDSVCIHEFGYADIVRSELVRTIISRYADADPGQGRSCYNRS